MKRNFEARLAVGVGSHFEIKLARVHEAVGDVNSDLGVVNGSARCVVDKEVSRAGANAAVDDGNGFGVGRVGLRESEGRESRERDSRNK